MSRPRRPAERLRVLLVEPDPLLREVLAEALQDLGYRVQAAPDLEAGLVAVRRIDAALIAATAGSPTWSVPILKREHAGACVLILGDAGPALTADLTVLRKPLNLRELHRLIRQACGAPEGSRQPTAA